MTPEPGRLRGHRIKTSVQYGLFTILCVDDVHLGIEVCRSVEEAAEVVCVQDGSVDGTLDLYRDLGSHLDILGLAVEVTYHHTDVGGLRDIEYAVDLAAVARGVGGVADVTDHTACSKKEDW